MTVQKKILDLTGTQYLVQKITGEIPVKISDLQDDVTLGTHIADTDIHVTTADKTKWNNGVSQSYVLRYSSSSVTDNSTIAFSTLDNTDNIKSGDKILDVGGKIFSIVSVDTANSTVTVGTALIDLALDANVVHTSGDETVNGEKTFNGLQIIGYGTQYKGARNAYILPEFAAGYSGLSITTMGFAQALKIGNFVLDANNKPSLDTSKAYIQLSTGESNGVNACLLESRNSTSSSLGTSANKWSKIYGTEYYYGVSNVEFSTKFVTTDTNQTITGVKTFNSNTLIFNSDATATTPNLYFRNSKSEISSQGNTSGDQNLTYLDKNGTSYAYIKGAIQSNGTAVKIRSIAKDSSDNSVINELQMLAYTNGNKAIFPSYSNEIDLGISSYKWKSFNGLTPSSLSLPDIDNKIDISSYVSDLTGVNNEYTPTVNGWICVRSGNATKISILDSATNIGNQSVSSTATYLTVMAPCIANKKVYINIVCTSFSHAYFIPCQGNV